MPKLEIKKKAEQKFGFNHENLIHLKTDKKT